MQKRQNAAPFSRNFYWYCLKDKDFFASFRSSSWTARWERQGLQISDCRKAEQPWIESLSICWQLSKFVLYVTQQSRDWRVRVNCGYVNMCPGNKFVNCSICTILVLKRGFWNFFFCFPLVLAQLTLLILHLNLLIPLIQQGFFLTVLLMLLENQIKKSSKAIANLPVKP